MKKKEKEKLEEISKQLFKIFDELGNYKGKSFDDDLLLWRAELLNLAGKMKQFLNKNDQ